MPASSESFPPSGIDSDDACFAQEAAASALLVLGPSLTVMSGFRYVRHAASLAIPVVIRRRAVHPRALLVILGLVGFYNVIYVMVNARMRFLVPVMPMVIALAADQLVFMADRIRYKAKLPQVTVDVLD